MGGRPTTRARFRGGWLLLALATVCGVWFGITAPDVSPVTPVPVPVVGVAP